MPELTDAEVFGARTRRELSDAEVFNAQARELTDLQVGFVTPSQATQGFQGARADLGFGGFSPGREAPAGLYTPRVQPVSLPGAPAWLEQLARDYGLSTQELAAQLLEAEEHDPFAGREAVLRPAKTFAEMSGRERREALRATPFMRSLLGPPAEEAEAMVEAPPSPGRVAQTILQFATPPPPVQELITGAAKQATKDLPAPVRGVTSALAEAAAGLPLIPGLPPAAGRALAGGFAADLTAQLPEAIEQLQAAKADGDPEDIWRSATALGAQVGFAVLAGRHAAKGPEPVGRASARAIARELERAELTGPAESPLAALVRPLEAPARPSEAVPTTLLSALEKQIRAPVPREAPAEARVEPAPAEPAAPQQGIPPATPGRRAINLEDLEAIEAEVEAQAARREALQVQPKPAELPPAVAGAETITGPAAVVRAAAAEVRTGTGMPAEREERPTPPLPQRKPRYTVERPWDLIDEIEGTVGGKIDPALIREANPNWRPVGAARALFRRGGRAADQVLNGITYAGPKLGLDRDTPLDQFGDAINAAARSRQEFRRLSSKAGIERGAKAEQAAAARDAQFTSKVLQGERPKAEQANVERVEVGGLVEGDTFKVQDYEFTVERIGFDEDGRATSVTLKDGPKFGIHKIGADEFIHIDKASLKQTPRPEPTFGPEGSTSELFSSETPFNLIREERRAPLVEKPAESLTGYGEETLAQQEMFAIEKIVESKDPLKSANAAEQMYGGPRQALAKIKQHLEFLDSDPETKRAFKKNQRAMLNEVQALLQQRVSQAPGIIADTGTEAWADRIIREGRVGSFGPLDPELMAAYVVKGAALLERAAKRGAMRFAEWAPKMIAEFGDPIRPHLRAIFDQAQAALKELQARATPSPTPSPPVGERAAARPGEGESRMRKLAARATTSPDVPPEHQAAIAADPRAYYRQQRQPTVDERVARMTLEELAALPFVQPDGTENIWVAARMELYKRLKAVGQSQPAYEILIDAAQRGTAMGQLVNQLKRLRGVAPELVVDMVEQRLEQNGLPPMQPKDRIAVHRGAEESINANQEWRQLELEWEQTLTDEAFNRVYDARKRAIEADRQLQERIRRINPASFWDMLTTIQQGNKITSISHGRNLIGNLSSLWMRAPARGVAAMFDAVDAYIRNRPRQATVAPFRTIPAALEAVGRSIPQSVKILINGATDFELSKVDARIGLRPLKALKEVFAGALRGKPFSYKAALALEALPFSWLPAGLRLLGAVDLPFREAARGRLVAEELVLREKRSKGAFRATQKLISQAIRIPELFFDDATLERINEEAAGAVFAQRNRLTSGLLRGVHSLPGPARFAIRLGIPFVKFPANFIREVLSFTPLNVAGAWHAARKGDIRGAEQAVGRVILGSMVILAGNWLYNRGLLGPPLDADDEQQKARIQSGQVLPPGHINISGLKRALQGEDGTWRAGDETRDIVLFGVGGALLWNVAAARRAMEKHPEAGSEWPNGLRGKVSGHTIRALQLGGEIVKDSTLATLGYAVNQSFLKGTADALDAIANQKFDQWFQGYAGSLLDVATPRQLENIARSMRQNVPVVVGDSNLKTLENVLRARLGAFGLADTLPLKRDLWGRPIRETPPGNLPWIYQNFDVSKTRTIADDPVNLTLYSLWRHTADPRVLPTPPDSNFIFQRERFTLTKHQVSRLQELTGAARRRLAERVVLAPKFQRATTDGQIAMLQWAYEFGATVGNLKFWVEQRSKLKERQKPAGFKSLSVP